MSKKSPWRSPLNHPEFKINKSLMTANVNFNKIVKGMGQYITATVTFRNGRKNVVHLYPRSYVNLANRYVNVNANKYKIARNSIANWEGRSNSAVNNLLANRYIMSKAWRTWINNPKYWGTASRTYQELLLPRNSKLKAFMNKMRRGEAVGFSQQKANNNELARGPYRGGGYVQGTPGQLGAARTMARIRAERARRHAIGLEWLAKSKFPGRNERKARRYPKAEVSGANWGNLGY